MLCPQLKKTTRSDIGLVVFLLAKDTIDTVHHMNGRTILSARSGKRAERDTMNKNDFMEETKMELEKRG